MPQDGDRERPWALGKVTEGGDQHGASLSHLDECTWAAAHLGSNVAHVAPHVSTNAGLVLSDFL